MSNQMTLDSLHSSLSLETAKLVRWEVETVVNMRDREGQIQQTAGVTATQEQMIPQLEEENLRLRGELSGVKHDREELGQRISYTGREVEVLGSQFMELQGELERLRGCPVVINTGKEIEELTLSVRELRLNAASSRKEAKRTWEELEMTRRNYEERENFNKKEMNEKIEEAKKEVERRENSLSVLKDKLNEVSAEVLAKNEDLDGSASSLAEAKAKQAVQFELNSKMEAELGEVVVSMTSRVEKMDRESVAMKEQLDKELNKNQVQEEQLNRLKHIKEKKISEKDNMDAVSTKKKEECHVLEDQVKTILVEVDRLSKMVEQEEKVEKDLEMLRADLRVCEENRKMIENEVVVIKRVEQQKVGLEKENMNMKSRADLLREKEESYNEDLAFCKNQMDEIVEKEEQLVIQLKGLDEEDSELEKEMAALDSAATHAMEEAMMTEVGNKELEEKIHKLIERSRSSADILKDLAREEASIKKNLVSVKTETEEISAAVSSAEGEGTLKKEAIKDVDEKEKEVTSMLSELETGLTKKLETGQLLKSKLDSSMSEEGKLRSLMESKRNKFLEFDVKKKGTDEENMTLENEIGALTIDKVKLIDIVAALDAELQVKRSHLVGMDSQVATEMEITRKKYEESTAELELAKKDVLEMVSIEEEVMKQLEAIELEIKSKRAVLTEKTKLEEKLGKEVMIADKESKAVEKNMKSKVKDIAAEESRLINEKQVIQTLNDELDDSEKKRLDVECEFDQLKKKKASDLKRFRAAVDKKAVDSNESLKEMEGKKEDLNNAIKEIESKTEKLDLWKKTDEAKKKLEKLEKSKECKVKKEKMMEEMTKMESLLSESKKEVETLSNLVRSLQVEIKKVNSAVEVDMVEVDSDEENITTRKVMPRSPSTTPLRNRSLLSVPSSTTTKRKLEDITSSSVKSGLDNIYQFGDSSDSEGQSQPKFQVPSTPRGRNIFSRSSKQVPFTPKGKQQQQKQASAAENLSQQGQLSSTSPAPSPLRTFALPMTRPAKQHTKGEKVKAKKSKEVSPLVSFDEVMAVSSDVDSN